MKRTGLLLSTVLLFILSLYVASQQGYLSSASEITQAGNSLINGFSVPLTSAFQMNLTYSLFALTTFFGGNLVAMIIALALVVELITLYPAVSIQLKQKKIHLFHKKLVDRFKSGELAMSKTKRELDVLYAVNEQLHKKGALLTFFQVLTFTLVLTALFFASKNPAILTSSFNSSNFFLLTKPVTASLPVLVASAYLLHALLKIHVKQREDYISQTQIYTALGFTTLATTAVYFFAANFVTLLSVYFIAQITFASVRYLIVEEKAQVWGKLAQKELIRMLQSAKLHKNKIEYFSRKFNHHPLIRQVNLHLLEEGMSMSLALLIVFTL